MRNLKLVDILLMVLLVVGFLGALKISVANLTGSSCPHLWIVPICYIVLAAYGLMIASVVIPSDWCKHYLFSAGWGTAFVVALAGSIAELALGGGVCPTSGGGSIRGDSGGSVPLCFVSLAMCVAILVLFLIGPYKRACDSCHSD